MTTIEPRPVLSDEEHDLHTGWRHVLFWQRGEKARAKRRTNKRERRERQRQTESALREELELW